MIKSVEQNPKEGNRASQIKDEVHSWIGKSIFSVSMDQMERKIRNKFPEIHAVELNRSFPDKIKLRYVLRHPIATLNDPQNLSGVNNSFSMGLDEEGVRFKMPDPLKDAQSLPELIFSSSETVPVLLSFLKAWTLSSQKASLTMEMPILRKISANEGGEITFYLQVSSKANPSSATGTSSKPSHLLKKGAVKENGEQVKAAAVTRVVWGNFDSQTFSEKFRRFQRVWSDLEKKFLKAEYINLRDVSSKNNVVLGNSEVVGRAFVRILKSE